MCGSIVGKSINDEFSYMNGIAQDAKIAFYDIGVTDRDYLIVPMLDTLFSSAYNAGARVHSNSWVSANLYISNKFEYVLKLKFTIGQ